MLTLKLLLVIASTILICDAGITVEQMKSGAKVVRITCMQKTKISEDRVNDLEKADFPDDRDLKCYSSCVLEMMNTMKKGKVNYDAAMKQIDVMVPESQKDGLRNAITICRDVPKEFSDNCDAGYALFKCLYKNNPHFFFP